MKVTVEHNQEFEVLEFIQGELYLVKTGQVVLCSHTYGDRLYGCVITKGNGREPIGGFVEDFEIFEIKPFKRKITLES